MRAQGAIDEEVTRRTACAELACLFLPEESAPVAHHLRHGRVAAQCQGLAQVLATADGGTGILVDAGDPLRGCGVQGHTLGSRSLTRGDRGERGLAQGVVSSARHRPIRRPPVQSHRLRHPAAQRR